MSLDPAENYEVGTPKNIFDDVTYDRGLESELRRDVEVKDKIVLDHSVIFDYLFKRGRMGMNSCRIEGKTVDIETFRDVEDVLEDFHGQIFIPSNTKEKARKRYENRYYDDLKEGEFEERLSKVERNVYRFSPDHLDPDEKVYDLQDLGKEDRGIAEFARRSGSLILTYDSDFVPTEDLYEVTTPAKFQTD